MSIPSGEPRALFDLHQQVAVITGASRGIGKAIALGMAEHGARVVVSSRKHEACEQVVGDIAARGGEAIAVACNIAHKPQLQELVERAMQRWGRIDTLVCNAAVNPWFGPSRDMPDEAYDRIMNSNVRSNFWLCNMVAPIMQRQGGGSIIIVSSIGGFQGSDMIGVYCISKAADMQLVRNLAVEWGAANIRANCIAPGLVRTDFARALWENPAILGQSLALTPLGRIGEPEDIAGAAVFLASRAGAYTTGQTITVDGGRTAGASRSG